MTTIANGNYITIGGGHENTIEFTGFRTVGTSNDISVGTIDFGIWHGENNKPYEKPDKIIPLNDFSELSRIKMDTVLQNVITAQSNKLKVIVMIHYEEICKHIYSTSKLGLTEIKGYSINTCYNNDLCYHLKELFTHDGFEVETEYCCNNPFTIRANDAAYISISWKKLVDYAVDSEKYKKAEYEFTSLRC